MNNYLKILLFSFVFIVSCSSYKQPCDSIDRYLVDKDLVNKRKLVIKAKFCKQESELTSNKKFSKVEGFVLDRSTGESIVASVYVKDSDKGTLCDSNGYFSLEMDMKDNQSVVVTSVGYDDMIIKNLDFEKNQIMLHILLGTTIIK